MLVLHVHDRWSAQGGADWHLVSILDSTPEGVETAVLCGRDDGTVGPDFRPTQGLHFLKNLDRKAPFGSEARVGESMAAKVREISPDLIHVHNILNPHVLEVLADLAPAVITVQDHRFFCPGRGKVREEGVLCDRVFGLKCAGCFEDEEYFIRLLQLVRARLEALGRFSSIVVLSRYMKEELVRVGVEPDRIRVVAPFVHGFDPAVSAASFGRHVLFAGRLVWAKGIFDLLEALTLGEDPFKLVVAGAGTMDTRMTAMVEEMGLTDRVEFLGWVSHHDLEEQYRRARVVVMPSRWQEPFGIVGLEAQSLGRPVVAYEVGGISEWLEDGLTGVLVPPGNVMALAASMNVLMREPDLANDLGQAARERTLIRFEPSRQMDILIGVYKRTI